MCGPGKYQSQESQIGCHECSAGKSGKTGFSTDDHDAEADCAICGKGEYQSATGQVTCLDCGAGTYNAFDNSDIVDLTLYLDKQMDLSAYIEKMPELALYLDKQKPVDLYIDKIINKSQYINKQSSFDLMRER